METESSIAVAAAVTILTQLAKWSGIPDRFGPLSVLLLSAVGVGLWAYSFGQWGPSEVWPLFTAWVSVAASAAGVFGFTRASAAAVTKLTPPTSASAGGNPTMP